MNGGPRPALARGRACVVTLVVVALAFVFVAIASDVPRLERPRSAARASRAAFAVRDRVPPFQLWGTRAFSKPVLESAYGKVEYLTLGSDEGEAKAAFLARLVPLLESGVAVDLFLLAHTNDFVEWVRELDATRRANLRLVYNTGCFNAAQRDAWLQLGAQAYVGHVGSSASYLFYVPFLRAWVRGGSLRTIVPEGNAFTARVLARVALFAPFDAARVAADSLGEIRGEEHLTIEGGLR